MYKRQVNIPKLQLPHCLLQVLHLPEHYLLLSFFPAGAVPGREYGKAVRHDFISAADNHGPLNDISQFPDIAGPVVIIQKLVCLDVYKRQVHALSYPLGAKYHVAHGESNYAMFTGVMKQYMEIKSDGEIDRLNRYIAAILGCGTAEVYDKLEELLNHLLPKKELREYGVTVEDLEAFTGSVLENQGRLLANNFVPLDRKQIFNIYNELY